ncbi:hypothetical protein ACQ7HM_20930 [Williamsia sp. MIQD14]|uniref:hypothetical protein n=1 Tax=Williamsia sp. MIQD14 TaxID=3425703 RepID=UPI003DA1097F
MNRDYSLTELQKPIPVFGSPLTDDAAKLYGQTPPGGREAFYRDVCSIDHVKGDLVPQGPPPEDLSVIQNVLFFGYGLCTTYSGPEGMSLTGSLTPERVHIINSSFDDLCPQLPKPQQ